MLAEAYLSLPPHNYVVLYIYKNPNEGDRDGKSAKTSATRNCLVNDHNNYVSPSLPISFFVFMTPFGSKLI